jgi:hypothetical protein
MDHVKDVADRLSEAEAISDSSLSKWMN